MRLYGQISKQLMAFLKEHTQQVEVFSIDEAFVELTGIPESLGMNLEEYVQYLQKKILQEIGVPVSF
jgi:DNA polymerase V